MANFEVALDLGSQFVSVASAQTGFVVKEPSLVAVDAMDGKSIKAVGLAALKMSRNPLSKVKLSQPIVEGTIADKDGALALLKALIAKVLPKNSFFSRAVVLCVVPCALAKTEKQKIEYVLNLINVKQTRFVAAPLASAVEIFKEFSINKGVICDMGADKTDIAVVCSNEIISGCTLYYGGRQIDKDICDLIHKKYNVQISAEEAERVKKACASLYANDVSAVDAQGINIQKGILENIDITARELYDVVANVVAKYCQVVESLFSAVPIEMVTPIKNEGLFLCGGLAQINGIDKYFVDTLKMNVRIPSECATLNVRGALKLL